MLCLSDLKQFSELLSEYRKSYPKAETNFLMMPGEITELCNRKMFFVSQSEGFLKILCDRGDYYNFYYYADKQISQLDIADVLEKAWDKDILIDVVISEKRNMTIGFPITNMVSDDIISEYKSYQRMIFCADVSDAERYTHSLAEGYSNEKCEFDYDAIISLWKDALDERSTPLPEKQELEEIFNDGRVLTVYSEEKRLSAVGVLSTSGRQAVIQHIAVSKADRRKGLARYVFGKLLLLASSLNIRVIRLWVDKENLPAVTLYDREGFEPDGMICKQYIFRRRTQL